MIIKGELFSTINFDTSILKVFRRSVQQKELYITAVNKNDFSNYEFISKDLIMTNNKKNAKHCTNQILNTKRRLTNYISLHNQHKLKLHTL